jgi:hypothetical protein
MIEQDTSKSKQVQTKMQKALYQFGIPLALCWKPDNTKAIHGELCENILFIYDTNENDAWDTFVHEILEFKLKKVTAVYRTLINSLIESFEKVCYQQKEEFLESVPKVLELIEELKSSSDQ